MDKLYSKKALFIKSIGCLLLGPIYYVLALITGNDDIFLDIVVSILPVGCLYTIPFWFTLSYIKKYRSTGVKRAILFDFLCCFIPAFGGMLICEYVSILINGKGVADGFITLVFGTIFISISLLFWLFYRIAHKK